MQTSFDTTKGGSGQTKESAELGPPRDADDRPLSHGEADGVLEADPDFDGLVAALKAPFGLIDQSVRELMLVWPPTTLHVLAEEISHDL